MIIVLVAARYQRILDWICEDCSIQLIKQKGPKLFLYVETTDDYQTLIHSFHKRIKQQGGSSYVYQFYSLYNGMIDYNDYLSEETKNHMKYYQSQNKDLSEKEIQVFLKKA